MNKKISIWQFVAGSVLAAGIFIIDLSLPLGVASGVPYVALVCLGAWFSKPVHVIFLAFISTALTILGYFFSEIGGVLWVVLINRCLALFAVWITALLLVHLKSSGANLAKSEQRFQDIAEASFDRIWEMDENYRYIFVSNSVVLSKLGERSPSAFIGKTLWEILGAPPETDEQMSAFKDVLCKKSRFQAFRVRMHINDARDSIREISGKPLFDVKGHFLGYRGSSRDITAQVIAEEKFQTSETLLRRAQKMEAIGQLTGGIAHDFNNILGIVLGNLEIIQTYPPGDSRISKRIGVAKKSIERGAGITRKLLGFSRKDPHAVKIVDINGPINKLLDLVTKSLTVSINVNTHLAEDLWTVEIDPGDFEDVILNLALNARDAMPGGGKLRIETENKILDEEFVKNNPKATTGSFVLVSISDTGIGMTDEVMDKVFEPFFTTKDESKGTGLGLSMVYGFVERSGGFVTIDSEIGTGTVFQLFIPRTTKNETDLYRALIPTGNLPQGREKILIVDDEKDLSDIAAYKLSELGYKTLVVEDGPSAIKILEQERDVDLLFSDVVMPNSMNAYELALKVHKRHPQIKILLTSGYDRKLEEVAKNDDPFLVKLNKMQLKKPYNLSDLAIAIRRELDEEL
ncbi:hypothetical protein A9Q83_11795 [Alphaproteobacteria bacterium 46_93_T64]|nr:hypothetical protein A9Q83_11795 [Alphaproteobacteria bacterium 46_93_T64]